MEIEIYLYDSQGVMFLHKKQLVADSLPEPIRGLKLMSLFIECDKLADEHGRVKLFYSKENKTYEFSICATPMPKK